MKYLFTFLFFLNSLFAHGAGESHLHFFSSLHTENFVIFIALLLMSLSAYKYLKQENN